MNMSRKAFLRWSAISTGSIILGTALPACGGGGGGGGSTAATAAGPTATPAAIPAAVSNATAPAAPAPVIIAASLAASRVSGVAPLYVNFDATGTTSTLSANPTHELFYSWAFGDASAGNWANGVQSAGLISKNAAFGPVTGHVFETPGTYTVNMVVMDGVNTETKSVTITVQDPNVVYAGTATICISSSGNFTGAPAGAQQVNTSGNADMYAAWNAYKGSNKRILFCKADSWGSSATVSIGGLTGTIVGGYGNGVAHTFASGTLVSVSPASGIGSMFQGGGSTDCRICNFKIAADATLLGCCVTTADSVALTMHKIEIRGAYGSFSVVPNSGLGNLFKHDQFCMCECLSDDVYGYSGVDLPAVTSASGAVGTPGVFTSTAHPFKKYNTVRLTGTPPAPLTTGTNYYISGTNLTANTFSLSATMYPDTPLTISSSGTCGVAAQGLSGGISAFIGLSRGGIMGCYLDSCNHGEQTLRIPYIDHSHINNNYIARPNQGKNIFKIHCRIYGEIAGISSGYSEKFVVSANVMDMRGGYSYNGSTVTMIGYGYINIGNGGGSGNERVRNVIAENNFTFGGLGNPKDSLSFIAANCPNITVRNNIADFSLGDRTSSYTAPYIYTGMNFATITTSTPDQTVGVRIFNNTTYSNLSNAEFANFVLITAPSNGNPVVDQVTIKNNLWYTPFHANAQRTAWRDSGGSATNIIATNNTDNVQTSLVSPGFVATPPVALTDWRPSTGSYAIGSGATVPVLRDFNQAPRVGGANNIGAVLP